MSIPTTDDLRLSADRRRRIAPLSPTQFTVIVGVLAAFWTASVVVVLVGFSLRAWEDRGHPAAVSAMPTVVVTVPAPADTRPLAVPASAQTVKQNLVLGDVAEGIHYFEGMHCDGGITTVSTSKELIYAEVPCDRMLPDATLNRLRGQVIRIRIVDGVMILEALFVGSFRLDVGRLWLETR